MVNCEIIYMVRFDQISHFVRIYNRWEILTAHLCEIVQFESFALPIISNQRFYGSKKGCAMLEVSEIKSAGKRKEKH